MKSLLSVLFLSILVCTSCTDELDSNSSKDVFEKDVEIVALGTKSDGEGGHIIKFKNQAVFDKVTSQLGTATTTERIAFADSLNIKTLSKLLKEADSELEKMADNASTTEEFTELYRLYKEKYSMFLFNDLDSTDLSPYSPLENSLAGNYVGIGGQVMIGNKMINNKMFTTYSESLKSKSVMSTREALPVNNAQGKTSKRKVGCHLSMNSFKVVVNFTCQKKTMFGWVRYSTYYNAKFLIHNFVWIKVIPMSGGVPEHLSFTETNNKFFEYESHKEQDGNYTFELGNIKGGSPWNAYGSATIWSRGVPFESAGEMTINMSNQ